MLPGRPTSDADIELLDSFETSKVNIRGSPKEDPDRGLQGALTELREALATDTSISSQQWADLKLCGLSLNHFLESHGSYYRPCEHHSTAMLHTQRSRTMLFRDERLSFWNDAARGCCWQLQHIPLEEDGVPLQDAFMHPQICAPRRLQMLPLTMDAAPLPLVLDVDGHFGTVSKIALQAYLRHEGHYRGPVHGDHVPSDAPLGNPETTTALQKLAGHANENGVFDAETVRALQGWLRGRELQCRVDGKWGPETKRALQTFLCRQSVDVGKAFHVVANGVFDARSRIALQVFLKCRNLYNGNIDGNFGEASKRALRQFVVREQMRLPEERRVGGDRTDGDLGFEGIDVDVSTRVKLQGLETARDGPAQEQKGTVLALQVLFNHDQLPINLS
mmetsp:Transcript_64915/g.194053  ORF Transcript_64915/g.194053 Transcript_64915/m.194053 type:complete len:391 (+) Transcript_64915:224-1396(+)